MKVGYLGPPGTYTEEAARTLQATDLVPCPTIADVFTAVAERTVERGVVPMENVIHGPVTETLDHLYRLADDLRIVDMFVMPIEHALGVLTPGQPITRILSKDQALKQCSEHLARHYPQAALVDTPSTAAAMQRVVSEKAQDAAVIGSAAALARHGLQVLARNIGNIKSNKTRFAVLAPRATPPHARTGKDATALVIYPRHDRIGLLQGILSIISQEHGLSCSSIHSRPDTQGAFRFYLEVEGHLEDPPVAACLASLQRTMQNADSEVRVFGTYPRHAFNAPRLKRIGILGGTGQMGQWLNSFFSAAGYDVLVTGSDTALTNLACAAQVDVVLINVPIPVTLDVIHAVAPTLKEGQLLVDNTSIKTAPVAAMLAAVHPGVEVLGMHTVFGPKVPALRQENVVFTRTPASGELASEFEAIFHKYGAHVTRTTPEHHDRQMALHQNVEHFTKVVLAELVRQSFGDPQGLDAYASPNSRASLSTMGRVLSGDAGLVAEIQTANAQGPQLIQAYIETARSLARGLAQGDASVLKHSFEASAQAFGAEYLRTMVERSRG